MSIATEKQRIKQAKEALKQAINAKGGTLTDEKLDAYADAVSGLSTGGGSEVYVAIEVEGVLMAQKLKFDETDPLQPIPDGEPEVIENVGLFSTGEAEPEYEGKCTDVN